MGGTFSERGGALAVAAQAGGVWPSMGGLRRPPRAAAPPCVLPQKLELPSAAGGFGSGVVRFGRSSSHRAPIGRRRPAPCSCWPAAARAGAAANRRLRHRLLHSVNKTVFVRSSPFVFPKAKA